MALIECPDCGRKVSDRAIACPDCGCPIADLMHEKKIEKWKNDEKERIANLNEELKKKEVYHLGAEKVEFCKNDAICAIVLKKFGNATLDSMQDLKEYIGNSPAIFEVEVFDLQRQAIRYANELTKLLIYRLYEEYYYLYRKYIGNFYEENNTNDDDKIDDFNIVRNTKTQDDIIEELNNLLNPDAISDQIEEHYKSARNSYLDNLAEIDKKIKKTNEKQKTTATVVDRVYSDSVAGLIGETIKKDFVNATADGFHQVWNESKLKKFASEREAQAVQAFFEAGMHLVISLNFMLVSIKQQIVDGFFDELINNHIISERVYFEKASDISIIEPNIIESFADEAACLKIIAQTLQDNPAETYIYCYLHLYTNIVNDSPNDLGKLMELFEMREDVYDSLVEEILDYLKPIDEMELSVSGRYKQCCTIYRKIIKESDITDEFIKYEEELEKKEESLEIESRTADGFLFDTIEHKQDYEAEKKQYFDVIEKINALQDWYESDNLKNYRVKLSELGIPRNIQLVEDYNAIINLLDTTLVELTNPFIEKIKKHLQKLDISNIQFLSNKRDESLSILRDSYGENEHIIYICSFDITRLVITTRRIVTIEDNQVVYNYNISNIDEINSILEEPEIDLNKIVNRYEPIEILKGIYEKFNTNYKMDEVQTYFREHRDSRVTYSESQYQIDELVNIHCFFAGSKFIDIGLFPFQLVYSDKPEELKTVVANNTFRNEYILHYENNLIDCSNIIVVTDKAIYVVKQGIFSDNWEAERININLINDIVLVRQNYCVGFMEHTTTSNYGVLINLRDEMRFIRTSPSMIYMVQYIQYVLLKNSFHKPSFADMAFVYCKKCNTLMKKGAEKCPKCNKKFGVTHMGWTKEEDYNSLEFKPNKNISDIWNGPDAVRLMQYDGLRKKVIDMFNIINEETMVEKIAINNPIKAEKECIPSGNQQYLGDLQKIELDSEVDISIELEQLEQESIQNEKVINEDGENKKFCVSCGKSINITAKFCCHCGSSVGKFCTNCGEKLSYDAKFCNFCGAKCGGNN